MSEHAVVLFEERLSANGKKMGVVTLNSEKSLNSLSLPMIELLQPRLAAWEQDTDVACVFLQGAGARAFCAGGDVVALYNSAAAYGEGPRDNFGQQFFTAEYRLDYHIHTYRKPIVVWGNGIVMGGGLGMMSGASHRVVTESTRMAMPEVTIGLYPDVGGTWFLNHAPGLSGKFLALTGASINAADAKYVGLADTFIPDAQKATVLENLGRLDWQGEPEADRQKVTALLNEFEAAAIEAQPAGNVASHSEWINTNTQGELPQVFDRITGYSGDDKWLAGAAKGLKYGCPITPYLVEEQFKRGADLSLQEVFQMELVMSVNCLRLGHFKEGVRALLIDKDRNPQWRPATFADVTPADVEAHFETPWQGEHPLADL